MKKILLFLTITIGFLHFSSSKTFAQGFPYEEYKTRALAELVKRKPDLPEYKSRQMMIDAQPSYSAIRVKYTGKSRAISDEKKSSFQNLAGKFGN